MRRATVFLVSALSGGALAVGCVSSSNAPGPTVDASFELDGGDLATGIPSGDSGASPVDATTSDAAGEGDAGSPRDGAAVDAPQASDSGTPDAGPGTVTSAATLTLTAPRQGHTATLLKDGRVLLCGGYYNGATSLSSCDIFDPTANMITPGPAMHFGRENHSATLLASGQVLVAGGTGGTLPDGGGYGVLQNAEIFDPTANTFTLVASSMQVARAWQAAVLLSAAPNANQVLFLGGYTSLAGSSASPTAEVFDPGATSTEGTFTLLTPQMSLPRASEAASLLANGQVLVAGGVDLPDGGASAETLDTALNGFTLAASAMSASRSSAQSTLLADGRVFVAGTPGVATADIFDPSTRSFTAVTLPAPRWSSGLATLASGRVLFGGGFGSADTPFGDVLLYDPTANEFLEANGSLSVPRSLATATTLQDGRVIIAGGQSAAGMVVSAVDIFTE